LAKFGEFSTSPLASGAELEVLEFWKKEGVFSKTIEMGEGRPRFVFYEGPPTANGMPGVHHALARVVKDAVCRYFTMRGYLVERKAGWDTHGLPVEIEVEKALGLDSKDQIESYGIAKFNAKCRESVFRYEREWRRLTERIGFWLDIEHPYITFQNEYIETVWWILKKFWEKGLIFQGHKILPYCPRCGTPLSSHELSQGYREVEDPSVYVRFRLHGSRQTSFLVWTTTPWTLVSNVALAVNPGEKYVRVRGHGEELILARERMEELELTGKSYSPVEEFDGSSLIGKRYQPVFPFFESAGAFRVVPAEFVSMEEGTGIVHIAPAFGEDDYQLGKAQNLPVLQPVDSAGRFTSEAGPFAGLFVKDADPKLIEDLQERGLLFQSELVRHSYPFCWRCDSPLIYYARSSWYIKTTAFRDELIEANRNVRWLPREVGENRFANWLRENIDWALSRDRFWGTPLNIWRCTSCGGEQCVGSIAELKELAGEMPGEIDLHRPYVDELVLRCPKCGGQMNRVKEVIDCWFDSGSMPYAQWHYPFENKEKFEASFPADFIAEGMDQTRGWFYSLLVISTFLSGCSCFKRVMPVEMVLDKEGRRMSKSKGNAVDPNAVLAEEGADPLRWYFITSSPPWIPIRFDREGVRQTAKKILSTLRNIAQFFVLYAGIDGFEPERHPPDSLELSLMDRWVLSRLNTVLRSARSSLDDFEITRAAKTLQDFVVEDVSNWYVRRSRRRFWKAGMGADKDAAYGTLYHLLKQIARMLAPFLPFVSEEIHQKVVRAAEPQAPLSVHMCGYPEPVDSLRDEELESTMAATREICSAARSARAKASIKVRQPLGALMVSASDSSVADAVVRFGPVISEEVNVKAVSLVDARELLRVSAKPRHEVLGPKFGAKRAAVVELIESLSADEVQSLRDGGVLRRELPDGTEVALGPEDAEAVEEAPPELVMEKNENFTLFLDRRVTEELRSEGFAREFAHAVQNLRKKNGYHVSDRIRLYCAGSDFVTKVLEEFSDYILKETLANNLEIGIPAGVAGTEIEVSGERVTVATQLPDD